MINVLELDQLNVEFERWGQKLRVLNEVSLTVPKGDWAVLSGHNGSGKSTLLRAIAGIQEFTGGQIRLSSISIKQLSADRIASQVFLIHQSPLRGTAPLLTLRENLRVASFGRKINAHLELELLDRIGLLSRADQAATTLSGGERQLLGIAIGRLRQPALILLDEPFSALDPTKQELAIDLLSEMHELGTSVLQVSHQPELMQNYATRFLEMKAGSLVSSEGPPLVQSSEGDAT